MGVFHSNCPFIVNKTPDGTGAHFRGPVPLVKWPVRLHLRLVVYDYCNTRIIRATTVFTDKLSCPIRVFILTIRARGISCRIVCSVHIGRYIPLHENSYYSTV